ncbi:hypothetical protein LTR08_008898 [Meristemomyces frigidus]|nr:hypothetical protein LTR08_008898 [Meristemomyces frigidus]
MADPYYQQQPQQQYRHPDPKISGYRDENAAPRRHRAPDEASTYDPSHFPPPPRSERDYEERSVTASYAGSEARDGQALAPYDNEKAYAQYSDAYGAPDYGRRPQAAPSDYGRTQGAASEYGGHRRSQAPPPSDYDRGEKRRDDDRRYDDRSRRDEPRERRRNSRPPPSDYSYSDDDTYDRDYDRRRRDSRPLNEDGKGKEKKSRLERGKDIFRSGGEGERGLGATLLGAAGGAFLGDQMSKNGKGKGSKGEAALGTLGGALVGAIGANAAERQWEKREKEKEGKEGGKEGIDRTARRSHEDEYTGGKDDPYEGGRGQSREDRPRKVDEFRPKRADRRGEPRRRRDGSSDSYTSDER